MSDYGVRLTPKALFIIHTKLVCEELTFEECEAIANETFKPELLEKSKYDKRIWKYLQQHEIIEYVNLHKLCRDLELDKGDAYGSLLFLRDCGLLPQDVRICLHQLKPLEP